MSHSQRECDMDIQSPQVTVIIATYNSSRTLKLSLATVLGQVFEDFEVWVVGDGCTDDSEAIAHATGDKRVYWKNLDVNSGTPSAPRNEGLRRARGRYIAYLGHDDLWFPWHLSGLVKCMEDEYTDFAYSLGILMGQKGVVNAFSLPGVGTHNRSGVSPSNWMHRRELTGSIGNWKTDLRVGDDREFLERVQNGQFNVSCFYDLSVIKFPAAQWKMYSLECMPPQESLLATMRGDARGLCHELLVQLAESSAKRGGRLDVNRSLMRKTAGKALRFVFRVYGTRRWPVNNFKYWRWRRKAGLSAKAGSDSR